MKQLTVMTVALASMLTLSAYAGEHEHTISVTGKADEKVKPDVAYVTVCCQSGINHDAVPFV